MSPIFTYVEGIHFVSCLQLVDQNIRQRQKDEANVRWIVIGIHDALYALLIEKLTQTDGFGIFKDAFEKEVAEFYRAGLDSRSSEFRELNNKSLNQSIAGLGILLKRAALPSGAAIPRDTTGELPSPTRGLVRIKEMRDYFSHPRPMLAGYYEDFLLDALRDTVEVVKEAINLPGNLSTRHDPREAQILLESIEYYLCKWDWESRRKNDV
ncbi:hypothetical protein J4729_11885 [Leisingera sp. HS039]|uniref:hypothetical protein n=1 Tax=unclassified Leisingera TaxID=2614906 RepID=UPI001070F8D8|nr:MULTISPECIES: hypothetical protein [unclassified Leisingera]MBQ4825240.1 hypothetical protein [Leisingera sp. HS039]QBR35080.1 hypothetical protein ETW23_01785 [Leisingera sp. NJS201]